MPVTNIGMRPVMRLTPCAAPLRPVRHAGAMPRAAAVSTPQVARTQAETQPLKRQTDAVSSGFSAEQLSFLERKRKVAAGEAPPLPPCASCVGVGTVVCKHCLGTGVNAQDAQDILGTELEDLKQTNGVTNVLVLLMKGGPCWMCRGKTEFPCIDCSATGIANFNMEIYQGD